MLNLNKTNGYLFFFAWISLLSIIPFQNIISQNQIRSSKTLDQKQESIVLISANAAKGNQAGLNSAIRNGLDSGLTINETKEILVHVYAYAGFPRSLNGLNVLMQILQDREKNGIKDIVGKDASFVANDKSKIELGTEIQTKLVGGPVRGEIYIFAPVIDRFLKEHLFADIFSRDVLNFQSREIVTVSILASLGGAESQLISHMKVALNVGITENQLRDIMSILESKVSWQDGQIANTILENILKSSSNTSTNSAKENQTINQNFTGKVWVEILSGDDRTWNTQIGNVTFSPGARTKWHYHPGGQILLITKGQGYYREKDQPRRVIRAGDIIKCPPNVPHWHGATPEDELSHIAIGTNTKEGPVAWLKPVTEAEYKGQKN